MIDVDSLNCCFIWSDWLKNIIFYHDDVAGLSKVAIFILVLV